MFKINFIEYSNFYKPKINNTIESFFRNEIKGVNNPFLIDFYSELKNYFLSGGKRIRPLLCIATYNAFSKNYDDKIIFPSISIELLHNGTLIHDDIIDNDDFRRKNPAFHYRFKLYHEDKKFKKMNANDFGNSIGIIGGDSVFFLGLNAFQDNEFELDLNLKAIQYYQEAFKDVSDGVLIELDMVNKNNLTTDDYIEMISLKTGALIERSILIGANFARVDEKYLDQLSILGINIGIIFQIVDDILGTFGDENTTGKPTDGDIREGKKTCLLVEALNKLDEDKKNRLNTIIRKENISKRDVDEVKKLFLEADVVNSCKNLAHGYFLEAKSSLENLKTVINKNEFEFFSSLLDFVFKREF